MADLKNKAGTLKYKYMNKQEILKLMIKYNGKIAYQFTKWKIDPLEELKETQEFELRLKALDGQELTKKEKKYITEKVNFNSYSKSGIPLLGWLFDFSPVLNSYLVKQYGTWQEYKATDKTALRSIIHGKIDKIIINL